MSARFDGGAAAGTLPRQPLVAARGDDLPDEVVAEFYAAAVGLLTWWIDHDFGRDPTPAWRATFDN